MPLNKYIDITFTGNLSLLDKNFNPQSGETESPVPADILENAWNNIELEYADMIDSGSLLQLLKKVIEVEILKANLSLIYRTVELLNEGYDKDLVGQLRGFGYNYKFDPENETEYRKHLEKTLKQSKQVSVKIAVLEAEIIKAYQPEPGGEPAKKKTVEDWDNEKLILEDEAKRDLNWDVKTVFEYAYRYKKLVSKIMAQKNRSAKWV